MPFRYRTLSLIPVRLAAGAFIFLSLLLFPSQAVMANWETGGNPICWAPGDQLTGFIVTDGTGGAIAAWLDGRTEGDGAGMYVQRFDGSGALLWGRDGIRIADQHPIQALVTDCASGAVLLWTDGPGLKAARIDHSGAILWTTPDGEISTDMSGEAVAVSDGSGGIITAWIDDRDFSTNYNDTYAQRIDGAGNILWTAGGVPVSADSYDDLEIDIASDGSGGALVCHLSRSGSYYMIDVMRIYGSGTTWSDPFNLHHTEFISIQAVSIDADASGGSIVAWAQGTDYEDMDIFAYKLDPADNKVRAFPDSVCHASDAQLDPDVMCDGLGGAFIVWVDDRNETGDIRGQRLDAYGVKLWDPDGVVVQGHVELAAEPELLHLYDSHLIVGWKDTRRTWHTESFYAQKLDLNGGSAWAADGVRVIEGEELLAGGGHIMADKAGCVFAVLTQDQGPGVGLDLYGGALNWCGVTATPAPVITDISDVPDDQGGKVRLAIAAAGRDTSVVPPEPVTHYNVWQQVPVSSAVPPTTFEADIITEDRQFPFEQFEEGQKRFLKALPGGLFPSGTWEFVGGFEAVQSDTYYFRATTLGDSSATGLNSQAYLVSSHTTDPFAWYVSSMASGYSVDNLAPAPPLGLAGEQSYSPEGIQLTWDPNNENDLWYYAIYRGTSSEFTPGAGNMIATPQTDKYFDDEWSWEAGYWYKISALDENGNESVFAVLGPDMVTGDEPAPLPEATFLAQNFPNPFNPSTTIAFGLKSRGELSLRIYDAAGRLVRTLAGGTSDAGRYELSWNGRDDSGTSVASGVYFYRLTFYGAADEVFEETRKMILLR